MSSPLAPIRPPGQPDSCVANGSGRPDPSDFTPQITSSPLLGEHTDDVLTELGYTADAIAEMHAARVV
jgi:crotonobetainyl-CoA:carnitine CoA-transferase CaiB-like acyl-CoA transferase